MAVVLQHFSATAQQYCAVTIVSLVPHGYVAVDFFFVLSGFIMSYTYLASFESAGLRATRDFLGKRVARVVPLNVAVLLLLVGAAAISVELLGRNIFFRSDNLPADLLANILMLQGLGIGTNLNGPSWSISTEFAAYLIFPFFVQLVFGRRAIISTLTLGIAIAALSWLALQHPRLGLDSDDAGSAVIRCFTEFLLGMGAYGLYRKAWFSSWIGHDFVSLGLAVASVGMLVLRVDLPAVLIFPLLVVSFARNKTIGDRLISSRLPYFLGVISYSLYLIHNAFRPVELELLRRFHPTLLAPAEAYAFALIGSLSIIPFAWLAYRLIEKPGRRSVRQLLARPVTVRAKALGTPF